MFYTFKQLETYFQERKKIGIKPGLERVMHLLDQVDHPEGKINGIHFAGTNGKGSTIQMVEAALVAQNYRVGVFTSPSFSGLTGHYFINGEPIDEKEVLQLFHQLKPHIDAMDERSEHPTEFEIVTVMAFMYFVEKTDIVLMETGMGGRYDTTNCFIPIISVITTIDYDHMQFLGDSIEEIASHKAGIMKRGQPLIVGKVHPKASEVILNEAAELAVPVYAYGEQFQLEKDTITIFKQNERYDLQGITLKGRHQMENAAVALMVLSLLEKSGIALAPELFAKSIKATTLPGRLETVHHKPTIILDSAHNLAGARALADEVIAMKIASKKQLLFAGFYDKQLTEMIEVLRPQFEDIQLTTFEHERAATASMLEHQLRGTRFVQDWKQAVDKMIDKDTDTTYFITGSLDFITKVGQYIKQQKTEHYR